MRHDWSQSECLVSPVWSSSSNSFFQFQASMSAHWTQSKEISKFSREDLQIVNYCKLDSRKHHLPSSSSISGKRIRFTLFSSLSEPLYLIWHDIFLVDWCLHLNGLAQLITNLSVDYLRLCSYCGCSSSKNRQESQKSPWIQTEYL